MGVFLTQCNNAPTQPTPGQGPQVPGPSQNPLPQAPGPVVFVGAGDIAIDGGRDGDTARLLDTIGGDIFTLGDNAYPNGSPENYQVFNRTWGRFLGRIHPTPGNHEYNTPGAGPYFQYFGESAGPGGQGYYGFDLGAWRIYSLNSNFDFGVGVDAGSPQASWLQLDLNQHPAKCTLAYWHHPLFSSGQNRNNPRMAALFRILYNANAEVVLTGHDHLYERFGPQTADGAPDEARGIRQFVVGTGGVPANYQFMSIQPNSDRRIKDLNGVLKLTLLPDSYQWEFVTTPNGAVTDSGSAPCH